MNVMWCTCKGGGGRQSGYVANPVDNRLWVHSDCGKPSPLVFQKVAMNRAPLNAIAMLSVYGKSHGVNEVTFVVKGGEHKKILFVHSYDRRPYSMGVNPNDILLNTWKRLDIYTEMLMLGPTMEVPLGGEELAVTKAKARAFAEVLSDMMPPFFTTADAVVREAIQRYQNRDNPEYETPGLGVKSLAEFDKPVLVRPSKPKPEVRLDENTQVNIKKALESGLFNVNQLAKSYGVSEAVIEAIRSA